MDAALSRLEAGRYGRCERCGQPIGADRLAARPTALTCIPARPCAEPLLRPQPFPAAAMNALTGSVRASLPSSYRIIAATEVMGLVIE